MWLKEKISNKNKRGFFYPWKTKYILSIYSEQLAQNIDDKMIIVFQIRSYSLYLLLKN